MEQKDGKERMSLEKDYTNYFGEFFENFKKEFVKGIGNKKADEFSSGELAFRDAISSLPCPVNVVRITIDVKKYQEAKNNVCHLVRYDFSDFGVPSVNYYGEIALDEIEKHKELLDCFDLDRHGINELKRFKLVGYGDPEHWFWVWARPYDILEEPEMHARDFMRFFGTTFGYKILEKFEKRIDYNAKYGLKSDPVLPLSELLKKDITFSPFVKVDKSGEHHEITLEDLQKSVCDIQLIPTVPEGVRKVFNAAKRLHIFGYFEYYFFTISQHYAFLALESALRNRYSEIYGKPKNFTKLPVIIKELVQKGIILKGEAKLYDAGRCLRNCHSHLTDPPILTPTSGLLERVAYQINQIWTQPITTGKIVGNGDRV
ncbi:MAG: hypothetical protein KAW19_09550 [Candidatus Aminicenantes bacterium]|nr:hypothetical protein [Candidatus Aminicenantes bacterium]